MIIAASLISEFSRRYSLNALSSPTKSLTFNLNSTTSLTRCDSVNADAFALPWMPSKYSVTSVRMTNSDMITKVRA